MPNNNSDQVDFREPLISGFLKSVAAYPGENAIWINERYYSYAELWQLVFSVYEQLPANKVYKQIGIYCNEDVDTYAAILAISLYGAAYVPLNNKFPLERNKNNIEACELELILTSGEIPELEKIKSIEVIVLTHPGQIKSKPVQPDLKSFQKTDQPIAYILFTSGTTAKPKGVPVSNSNADHFFDFFLKNYDFTSKDRFLQVYELTFDVSVFSFLMPLYVGACCYIVPNEGLKFMKIIQSLERHKITVVSMVPSVLRSVEKYLHELKLPDLRYSFFSGETLYHQLAKAWSNVVFNAEIHNFYGPTETTIVCTRYIWKNTASEKESVNGIVPLGKPFKGMEKLIVDENNLPTEKGELCFTGTQVISNYLNCEWKEQFFNYNSKRYYKTGDHASENKNGNLIYHGRTDGQIKMNGYRIEPAEIEFAIQKICNARSVVFLKNERLIAFIESEQEDETFIKEKLSFELPGHMVPFKIISVNELPLTINGKVDKNTLVSLAE